MMDRVQTPQYKERHLKPYLFRARDATTSGPCIALKPA